MFVLRLPLTKPVIDVSHGSGSLCPIRPSRICRKLHLNQWLELHHKLNRRSVLHYWCRVSRNYLCKRLPSSYKIVATNLVDHQVSLPQPTLSPTLQYACEMPSLCNSSASTQFVFTTSTRTWTTMNAPPSLTLPVSTCSST